MRPPRVSVVTIFLDEERFLAESVESVLAQDFASWELLLIDDGSSDGSAEIARRYAGSEPRIVCLEHPGHENRGMSASRNLGLQHAQGEILALLDADDVWFPDTLSRQVGLLDRHSKAAMVYGDALWWRTWAGDDQQDWVDGAGRRAPRPDTLLMPPEFVSLFLRDGGAVPCPCTVAVRVEAAKRMGGFEDDFRTMHEDQVLFAKIGLDYPVLPTTTCLGKYRQHDRQCCVLAEKEGTVAASHIRFLAWLDEYASARGISDTHFWSELHRAREAYDPSLA